ncbi:MAG: DUF1844 domain-containing protein [Lentisphaerae bacterium]|nr:DUF1844 domain-containing protein [Lentisphaerota bacterium]
MSDDMSREQQHQALFANLLMMLSTTAMQQLGKIVNPVTRKTEVDLEGAQLTIDMIEMLQTRTRGNLSRDEDRMLSEILSSLQMNYVESARGGAGAGPEAEEAEARKQNEPESRPEPPEGGATAGPAGEAKNPKYHKSYG